MLSVKHDTSRRAMIINLSDVIHCLFLSEPALHPASVHLQLLGSVDQEPAVDAQIFYFKQRSWGISGLYGCFIVPSLRVGQRLAFPNLDKLVRFEKVNARAIAPDVKVLFQVPAFLEADLGEVTSAIVTEADLAAGFQDTVDIVDGLLPL